MNTVANIVIDPQDYPDIIMDLDDVVCDTAPLFQQTITKVTGINIPLSKWTDFYLPNIYDTLDQSQITDILCNSTLCTDVQPITNIDIALQKLRQFGYKIHLCTARAMITDHEKLTLNWLSDKGLEYDSLHFVNHGLKKSEKYKNMKVGYLFDDAIHNLDDAFDSGNVIQPIIINKNWNTHYKRCARYDSVYDFCKLHKIL